MERKVPVGAHNDHSSHIFIFYVPIIGLNVNVTVKKYE